MRGRTPLPHTQELGARQADVSNAGVIRAPIANQRAAHCPVCLYWHVHPVRQARRRIRKWARLDLLGIKEFLRSGRFWGSGYWVYVCTSAGKYPGCGFVDLQQEPRVPSLSRTFPWLKCHGSSYPSLTAAALVSARCSRPLISRQVRPACHLKRQQDGVWAVVLGF